MNISAYCHLIKNKKEIPCEIKNISFHRFCVLVAPRDKEDFTINPFEEKRISFGFPSGSFLYRCEGKKNKPQRGIPFDSFKKFVQSNYKLGIKEEEEAKKYFNYKEMNKVSITTNFGIYESKLSKKMHNYFIDNYIKTIKEIIVEEQADKSE